MRTPKKPVPMIRKGILYCSIVVVVLLLVSNVKNLATRQMYVQRMVGTIRKVARNVGALIAIKTLITLSIVEK